MNRVWKANVHMSPSCPRCGSSNTKFCYYNNYSLTQPRYLCKGCRRYSTKGGSLRNVPVGGGCRKNRRCRSIRVSTAEAAASRANLACGAGGHGDQLMKGNRFDSNNGSSASPEGSHIDLALVYANYLNHKSESKGELETEGPDGGWDSQFTSNAKRVELANIEFLRGNELIGCELLSNLFTKTLSNNEDQVYHEGFCSTDTNREGIQGCNGIINTEYGYSLPPLPNEEVESWWPDSCTETMSMMMMNHVGFQELDFSPAVFGSFGGHQDSSFVIAKWGDSDLPFDDASSYTVLHTLT